MTEVLSSKYYGHDALEMDFTPRQSTSVNVDSDEVRGSPSPPLALLSPRVSPLVDESSSGRRRESSGIDRDAVGEFEEAFRRRRDHIVGESDEDRAQLSVLALLLAAFRRTGLTCQAPPEEIKMEISWPTDVRHVTHVTFDRFNGFLGLPVEFEMEIPRRAPSASASVFGVSAESMQCSYDRKGNSVPTILLLLQERLYDQGGLKAEGIFRINAENSQEEHVRDQLNKGIVPHDIDVHCLAGLIKAWFRELPKGVLDSLSPEQVMQCHTEEQSLDLVKLLPATQAALLDWAINLMADVVQEEEINKMNARNIAMVFAPNMTQMSDPLTALMHAVQVMNLLKTLILKTLRDREEAVLDPRPAAYCLEPPNGNGDDNTKKGPFFGVYGIRNQFAENNSTSQSFFIKGFSYTERTGENNCSEDLDEIFLSGFSGRETTDEDELSNDSRGPFSNGSSTMDNTDDESNGFETRTSNTCKIGSIRNRGVKIHTTKQVVNVMDRAGTSAESVAFGNSKAKSPVNASGMKGMTETSKVASEDCDIKDVVQCGIRDSSPSKGKGKGGRLVGKVDQQSERVEAW